MHVTERAKRVGQFVRAPGADGDFDALDRVHYQQTQLSIKDVVLPNNANRGSSSKLLVRLPERVPIATQPERTLGIGRAPLNVANGKLAFWILDFDPVSRT